MKVFIFYCEYHYFIVRVLVNQVYLFLKSCCKCTPLNEPPVLFLKKNLSDLEKPFRGIIDHFRLNFNFEKN